MYYYSILSMRSVEKKHDTLLKFNSLPLKSYLPNRKVVFQPSFFRGELLNFQGVPPRDEFRV